MDERPHAARQVAGSGLAALTLISVVVAILSWLLNPLEIARGLLDVSVSWGLKPIMAPVVLFMAYRFYAGKTASRCARVCIRLAFSFAVLLAAILLAEGCLALAGYEAKLPPIVIQGADEKRTYRGEGLVSDMELRWKFKPGEDVWGITINEQGFRDRELVEKPPGGKRVVCLGDSCTVMGGPPYSGMLHIALQETPPSPGAWDAYNLGVFGYSVVQGRKVFEQFASVYQPGFVTIYFGWNDHWWSGKGRPDSSMMAVPASSARAYLVSRLGERRLGQMIAGTFLLPRGTAHRATGEEDIRRVPEDEYTQVLGDLVADIRRVGATPILITAPRGPSLAKNLVERGNITSVESGLAIHDRYVELTRQVSKGLGVPLVDLAGPGSPLTLEMFKDDGIHLRYEGNIAVARAIHAKLLELNADSRRQGENHN